MVSVNWNKVVFQGILRGRDISLNTFLLVTIIPLVLLIAAGFIQSLSFLHSIEGYTGKNSSRAFESVMSTDRTRSDLERLREDVKALTSSASIQKVRVAYVNVMDVLLNSSFFLDQSFLRTVSSAMNYTQLIWHARLNYEKSYQSVLRLREQLIALQHDLAEDAGQMEAQLKPTLSADIKIEDNALQLHEDVKNRLASVALVCERSEALVGPTQVKRNLCTTLSNLTSLINGSFDTLDEEQRIFQHQSRFGQYVTQSLIGNYAKYKSAEVQAIMRQAQTLQTTADGLAEFGAVAQFLIVVPLLLLIYVLCRPPLYIAAMLSSFKRREKFENMQASFFIRESSEVVELVKQMLLRLRDNEHEYAAGEIYNAQLKHLSTTDDLTGLDNRRALHHLMEQYPVAPPGTATMMMDIDAFKVVNDTKGHPFGDVILKCLANIIRNEQIEDMSVFRYGGEEFCVVIFNQKPGLVRLIAERIRASVRSIDRETAQVAPAGEEAQTPLTISIGVSYAVGHTGDYSIEDLLRQADFALYEAKRTGQDRVCVYDEKKVSTNKELKSWVNSG